MYSNSSKISLQDLVNGVVDMSNRRVDGDFGVCGPTSLLVDGCRSLGTGSILACDADTSFKLAKLTLRLGVARASVGSGGE